MARAREINEAVVRELISLVDAGLVCGVGTPVRGGMCVEAAVCFALKLPHGDDPGCVARAVRALKITLNDACWSTSAARAAGMRRLAVLQLGTLDGFDDVVFAQRLVPIAQRLVPIATRAAYAAYAAHAADAAYAAHAAANAAANAAADAADAAAHATRAAYAANAANVANAANAADAAANAAHAADAVLLNFAHAVENILIDMNVPGVQWLPLLESADVQNT